MLIFSQVLKFIEIARVCTYAKQDMQRTLTNLQDIKDAKSLTSTRVKLLVGDNELYGNPTQFRRTIGAL